jgi:hypothetical protein
MAQKQLLVSEEQAKALEQILKMSPKALNSLAGKIAKKGVEALEKKYFQFEAFI